MGSNPHANGGKLLRALDMPDFRHYAVDVPAPTLVNAGNVHILGPFLRDVIKRNEDPRNFRVFGPDETLSNRLEAVFEVTNRQWDGETVGNDQFLAPGGSVMEMLSEHQCEGWLEGYLLTGRHGIFNSYEAFIRIVDSMFTQHAKWLKMSLELPWRRKIASLNYLLTSHVWRQDHNGFTHQDPGFIDHVVNKKSEMVRVYLPPDANCLLSTMDHCLRSLNYITSGCFCGPGPLPDHRHSVALQNRVLVASVSPSVIDWPPECDRMGPCECRAARQARGGGRFGSRAPGSPIEQHISPTTEADL